MIKQSAFELSAQGGDDDQKFGVCRRITFGKFQFGPFSRSTMIILPVVSGKANDYKFKTHKSSAHSLAGNDQEMMTLPVSAAAGAQKSTPVNPTHRTHRTHRILKQKQLDPTKIEKLGDLAKTMLKMSPADILCLEILPGVYHDAASHPSYIHAYIHPCMQIIHTHLDSVIEMHASHWSTYHDTDYTYIHNCMYTYRSYIHHTDRHKAT